ncbi:co-chaperone HscB [Vibrio sp.]|uniref:Co-chaperone protein HscB homolog n=1 Tax=Vibrio viridaestus TaxID=2487322 RepID=A0A3N9TFP6_9VIBR|nr:co-chaperone HscB [Vibrio viridaestus]MDC0609119.1 co-chaperone HscB [Vibrio sp.]RQW62295.1 co-chaperone HscB [Vibrio viridaestus]
MNYFELFGLPTQFSVDGSLLSSQFRVLQKRFHPDNFASGTERERLTAIQKASEINDAFQILKNPISRTEYLLSLNGVDIRDEQQTMQDPEFLMQQMELREELEEIESSSDIESALFDFDAKVAKLYKELIQQVETELEQAHWETAAITVRKLKFIAKLKNEIARVEDKLLS